MILASEIGDKTFFISAIMAMSNRRSTVSAQATPPGRCITDWQALTCFMHLHLQVFAGAIVALALMTVLSAALGWAAPNLVRCYGARTHYSVRE